jgi:Fe-S cluster assembly protein SufB
MSTTPYTAEDLANREYKYGFVTDIETDTVPRGLNEGIVRVISAKKGCRPTSASMLPRQASSSAR